MALAGAATWRWLVADAVPQCWVRGLQARVDDEVLVDIQHPPRACRKPPIEMKPVQTGASGSLWDQRDDQPVHSACMACLWCGELTSRRRRDREPRDPVGQVGLEGHHVPEDARKGTVLHRSQSRGHRTETQCLNHERPLRHMRTHARKVTVFQSTPLKADLSTA